jgi:cobalamin biosynthesis protein CobT
VDFLTRRKDITIAQANWRDYTSRLVARVVFMVWDHEMDGENGQGKEREDREGIEEEETGREEGETGREEEETGREEGEGGDNFADDTAEVTMASTERLQKKAWWKTCQPGTS